MNYSDYKAGIIGVGTIFAEHLEAYQALGVEVKTIADIDSAKLSQAAAKYSVKNTTGDWRRLAEDPAIHIVSICTPPKFHKEMVIACLKAGKHVICEKPLALNLAEADEILKAEAEAAGKLTVSHQLRFSPDYQKIKTVIESMALGRVSLARCVRYDAPPQSLVEKKLWGNWEMTGGGILMTKAIHQIDLLLWLLGKVKRVQAAMGTYFYDIESEDQVAANLEFESGALAAICVSGQPHSWESALDFVGSEGIVCLPWNLNLTDKKKQKDLEEKIERLSFVSLSGGGKKSKTIMTRLINKLCFKAGTQTCYPRPERVNFLKNFLDGLSSRSGSVPVSAFEGRQALEVCTAIYASALKGSFVDLPLTAASSFYRGIRSADYEPIKNRKRAAK